MTCPVRVEPDLGAERFCRRCDEWWPLDAEFWYLLGQRKVRCKACHLADQRAYRERHADAIREQRRAKGWTPWWRTETTEERRLRQRLYMRRRRAALRFGPVVEKNVSNISTKSVDIRAEIGGQPAPDRRHSWIDGVRLAPTLPGSTPQFGGVS